MGRKPKKFTTDDLDMMVLHQHGTSNDDIAEMFDVSNATVSRTINSLKRRVNLLIAGANASRTMYRDSVDALKGILLESIHKDIDELEALPIKDKINLLSKLNSLSPPVVPAAEATNDPFDVFEVEVSTVEDAK